jgi:hypothetical protein
LKDKIEIYETEATPNEIFAIIRSEINNNITKKIKNLSGEPLDESSYNIFSTVSFVFFKPNLGPLVKLNMKAIYVDDRISRIQFKRFNAIAYYFQTIFFLIISLIGLSIAIYKMTNESFNEGIEFLLLPTFGFIYILIVELIAASSTSSIRKRVISLLNNNKIELNKSSKNL